MEAEGRPERFSVSSLRIRRSAAEQPMKIAKMGSE